MIAKVQRNIRLPKLTTYGIRYILQEPSKILRSNKKYTINAVTYGAQKVEKLPF